MSWLSNLFGSRVPTADPYNAIASIVVVPAPDVQEFHEGLLEIGICKITL